jgi:uncharacterized protein (TIGR02145 family)
MKKIKNYSIFAFVLFVLTFTTSCDTENLPDSANTGTVKDIDGNTYHTVKIGTQVWMVENLKTTKYNDGTAIPEVTDNTSWSNLTTGAYCNYNNNVTIGTKYGKLYNWYAVNTGKLAPAGWHVPTDAEWTTLENYVSSNLGTSGSVAKALAATVDWAASTTAGAVGNDLTKNNSTGFSALPGGNRYEHGSSGNLGDYGFWWSSSKTSATTAWYRYMHYYSSRMLRDYGDYFEVVGFSVRCVKD